MNRPACRLLRFPTTTRPPAPSAPSQPRWDTRPLGNKLQVLAITDPATLRDIERMVDAMLRKGTR